VSSGQTLFYQVAAVNGAGTSSFSPASGSMAVDSTTAFLYFGRVNYFSDGPPFSVPRGFNAAKTQVQYSLGGAWQTKTGTRLPDGYGIISGVPPVPVYFTVTGQSRIVFTSDRYVDLSADVPGRASDQNIAASGITPVTFNVTNLAAWQGTDFLNFADTNAGIMNSVSTFSPLPGANPIGIPAPGDTQLSGFTVDASQFDQGGNLGVAPDSTQGDAPFLAQLDTFQSGGGIPYQAVTRVLNIPTMTVTDGRPTIVSGSFTDVPAPPAQTAFKYNRPAFNALASAVNPNATISGDEVLFWSQPVGSSSAPRVFFEQADIFQLDVPAGTGPVSAGSVVVPNPYPSAWYAGGTVGEGYQVNYSVPGTAAPVAEFFAIQVNNSLSSLLSEAATTNGLSPHVFPVENVTVTTTGGASTSNAFLDNTGLGLNPKLSWKPSSVSGAVAPNYYRLFITGLTDGNFFQIYTLDTVVTIPPGVFQTGTTACGASGHCYYFVELRAVNEPCRNAVHAPIAPRCEVNEWAEIATGLMSP
jgi:hypothetical protein